MLLALAAPVHSHAQTEGLGTWNIVNARLNFNPKWAAWTELQTRSYKIYDHFFYHELKGGFQYNINNTATALMGIGQYATYSPGGNFKPPVSFHEFRMWEQLSLTNNIERLKLEHRFRMEQRWLTSGYRNRYRYRLSAILPLNHKKIEPKTVYLNVFNEIFLTNTAPYFERNRFYVGTGYQFTKAFTLQCGLLKQFDYRANGVKVSKVFLQTSLLFNFSLKKQVEQKEQHPSAMD